MSSAALPFCLLPPATGGGILSSPLRFRFSSRNFRSRRSSTLRSTLSSSSWEREEERWLREEQRWLREEQRWLREESRWSSEREVLLREVAVLRARIQALEVKRVETAPPPPASSLPLLTEEASVKEIVIEKIVEEKRQTLRIGSEGGRVREMQEGLMRLGFYPGEEDMEFSSFSHGTERAVKTWQASVGSTEDGIMTSELLEKLFSGGEKQQGASLLTKARKENGGATISSANTEIAKIEKMVIKERGGSGIEVSKQRVFLLGENRWEEPSRLAEQGKKQTPIKASNSASSTIRCLSCCGEGRLLCTECDGTGEPNIEPQFMEWIEEGTKCPYCEGLGYTVCDVCEGRNILQS